MKSKKELLGTEVQEKTIKRTKPGKVLHYFLILFGFISLGVGIIGIFLPLVPTTPLILLAAACFLKSSPKLYYWLTKHKTFGTYITNYLQSGRVPAKSKPYSIAIVWICISISAFSQSHYGSGLFYYSLPEVFQSTYYYLRQQNLRILAQEIL